MLTKIKHFCSSSRGNFAIMTALLSLPVLAGVAMTIEHANLSDNHARLQNAVDAAALYVGKYQLENDDLPTKRDVRGFVINNFDGDVNSVRITGSGGGAVEYKVSAKSKAPQFFFGDVLPDIYDQYAEAMVPKPGASNMAVALVLDTTTSMGTSHVFEAETKIETLRQRAVEFIDEMEDLVTRAGDIRVGIVPYDNHVNVGLSNRDASWVEVDVDDWEGCVGSRASPYTFKDTAPNVRFTGVVPEYSCPQAVTPLTDDWDALRDGINALTPQGITYAAPGVMWGLRVLSPALPFDEVSEIDDPRRVMIVMADGDNTATNELADSKATNDAWDDADEADGHTRSACDEAKFQGVTIYAIAFGLSISNSGKSLLQDCASTTSNYYEARDSDELEEAFDDIASQLTRLRLSG